VWLDDVEETTGGNVSEQNGMAEDNGMDIHCC